MSACEVPCPIPDLIYCRLYVLSQKLSVLMKVCSVANEVTKCRIHPSSHFERDESMYSTTGEISISVWKTFSRYGTRDGMLFGRNYRKLFSKKILEPSVGMTESVTKVSVAVGAVHLQPSSGALATIALYVLRSALTCISDALVRDWTEDGPKRGWTQENLFSAGLLLVVIAVDLFSGMLFGTILAPVSLLLVSVSKYGHGWIPLVNDTTLRLPSLMFVFYNNLSGLVAVLGAIHSYLGLQSQAYLALIVVMLLVAKYRNGGRWLDDDFPLAGCASTLWHVEVPVCSGDGYPSRLLAVIPDFFRPH